MSRQQICHNTAFNIQHIAENTHPYGRLGEGGGSRALEKIFPQSRNGPDKQSHRKDQAAEWVPSRVAFSRTDLCLRILASLDLQLRTAPNSLKSA
eukprot:366117-Chlamydomonas_euryale.AAC.14